MNDAAGMQHLDVAGGTGDVAFRVLRAIRAAEAEEQQRPTSTTPLAPGSVVVSDINPDMLAVGKQKATESPDLSDGGLSFVVGDAEQLPFPSNHFDAYTIAFGIRNVTDRDAALQEAHRVLKPGGRLLVLEFSQVILEPAGWRLYCLNETMILPRQQPSLKETGRVFRCCHPVAAFAACSVMKAVGGSTLSFEYVNYMCVFDTTFPVSAVSAHE